MNITTRFPISLAVFGIFIISFAVNANTDNLIADIHANPPAECTAKSVNDKSSGIAIFPNGKTDEELRGVMGGLASMFMSEGGSRMSPSNTQVVYTAVFYEQKPINEIGIYGYKFVEPISPDMFVAHKELNGDLFVVSSRLLVLLWHEKYERTARCYEALKQTLLAVQ